MKFQKRSHNVKTNVEATFLKRFCASWVNIRRLNFHFQPNFNVETTLVHRRWIDVILSTLFQRCFVNVETTSINVRRLNFHFQPNINVETTLMNVDDQRCFNVDSTLMCLPGSVCPLVVLVVLSDGLLIIDQDRMLAGVFL